MFQKLVIALLLWLAICPAFAGDPNLTNFRFGIVRPVTEDVFEFVADTIGYGRYGKEMLEWLTEAGLTGKLTPREKDFLKQKKYSDQERAWAAWQFASQHACAWTLGLEEMEPLGECPDTLTSHFPPKKRPNPSASLRSFADIYAETDFYYRLHWTALQ